MTNTRRHIWNFFLRVRAWPSTGPWYIKYRFRLSKAAFYVCLQSPRFMREIVIFGMWFYKWWSKSILWLICYHSKTYKARPCPFIQKIILDAPTNSKFLDFSQLHPYFHLVKSFFIFFCNFHNKQTYCFAILCPIAVQVWSASSAILDCKFYCKFERKLQGFLD